MHGVSLGDQAAINGFRIPLGDTADAGQRTATNREVRVGPRQPHHLVKQAPAPGLLHRPNRAQAVRLTGVAEHLEEGVVHPPRLAQAQCLRRADRVGPLAVAAEPGPRPQQR